MGYELFIVFYVNFTGFIQCWNILKTVYKISLRFKFDCEGILAQDINQKTKTLVFHRKYLIRTQVVIKDDWLEQV